MFYYIYTLAVMFFLASLSLLSKRRKLLKIQKALLSPAFSMESSINTEVVLEETIQAKPKTMKEPLSFKNVFRASLLISGTAIGAGMLGLPVITSQAGFLPALLISFLVWIFMYCTGLLFLEATLWMKEGSNILSMAERFLGKKRKVFSGAIFIFLYYSLMTAYFAAGAPLIASLVSNFFSFTMTGWVSYAFFGLVFGLIIAAGLNFVDRLNYVLMIALVAVYLVMVSGGVKQVNLERLFYCNWKSMAIAAPVLFSAFGYHNIIPPLTFQYKKNPREMRWAIFLGSFIPFLIYAVWQWLIMGTIPREVILETYSKGLAITETMGSLTGYFWLSKAGSAFGLFAIVTSMLGVSYSVYDFINDGLKTKNTSLKRILLCFLTFLPPFIMTSINPAIFLAAIGIAGGFGEAFLNGILPIWLVWKGRYKQNLKSQKLLNGGKGLLVLLLLISFIVMLLEVYVLLKH